MVRTCETLIILFCCLIVLQENNHSSCILFIGFGLLISLVLALERKQEQSCMFCLPTSVTITLICVQAIAIPPCSVYNSPTLQLQFLLHKSISV